MVVVDEAPIESSAPAVPEVLPNALATLAAASAAWVEQGREAPVARWLDRELDVDGVPRRLAVSDWAEGLQTLAGARSRRAAGWPDRFDAAAEGWFRATLRYARPDGSPVFSAGPPPEGRRVLFRGWADRLTDPGLTTVVDWWFPRASNDPHAPPPLPADARPDRALAVLRANWARDGDLIAVDHRRDAGSSSRFELFGQGRTWLGPTWGSGDPSLAATRAEPVLWSSRSAADHFEWSFRVGRTRVVRTAVLLRGRRLAVLGEQRDGPGDPGPWRMSLPDGVETQPIPESRGLSLVRGRSRAQVLPVGLPRLDYPTERGTFGVEGGDLVLRPGAGEGDRRGWRVLVVSWEPQRNRQPVHWRTLTVSEASKACGPETAFAARVTWGRDDTLVIYRSLAPPAVRAFLGHQTRARFLIGLFSTEGEVEPLVKVEG